MIRLMATMVLAGSAALGVLLWQSGFFGKAEASAYQEGDVSHAGDWDGAFVADGYYLPMDPNRAYHGWIIEHIHIAADWRLNEWMQMGQDPEATPIWMDFRHIDSDIAQGEMGAYYTHTKRVRAENFAIFPNRFVFQAQDDEGEDALGQIVISGTFDPEQINPDSVVQATEPALNVRISMAGQELENQGFYYYVGH